MSLLFVLDCSVQTANNGQLTSLFCQLANFSAEVSVTRECTETGHVGCIVEP